MLERSEYDAVDVVSSFISVLVNKSCSLLETAEITESLIEYVDVVSFMNDRFFIP